MSKRKSGADAESASCKASSRQGQLALQVTVLGRHPAFARGLRLVQDRSGGRKVPADKMDLCGQEFEARGPRRRRVMFGERPSLCGSSFGTRQLTLPELRGRGIIELLESCFGSRRAGGDTDDQQAAPRRTYHGNPPPSDATSPTSA